MQQTFRVKAVWDAEAEVFYSQSDIEGLHIEAATLDEFEAIMLDVAPELIMVNHRSTSELAEHSLKELIPAIVLAAPGDRAKVGGIIWRTISTGRSPKKSQHLGLSIGKVQKAATTGSHEPKVEKSDNRQDLAGPA